MSDLKCTLLEYRVYGQPKIHKPKCLKWLKPVLKLRCMQKPVDVYESGDGDIVAYFGTLFSKVMAFPNAKDMALPYVALKAKYPERLADSKGAKGFIYADAWCPILERNEGWVRFENLALAFQPPCTSLYFPRVQWVVFEEFRKLSLLDKGFCDIANYDDMCAAEYRRCVDDIVSWLWKRLMERGY